MQVDPADIEICKKADGEPWLLGSGAYGQVQFCSPLAALDDRRRNHLEYQAKPVQRTQRNLDGLLVRTQMLGGRPRAVGNRRWYSSSFLRWIRRANLALEPQGR